MKVCSTIFSTLALAICLVITDLAQQTSGTPASSPFSSTTCTFPFKIAVIEEDIYAI
jgi:hypothetical protein